jgi:hypothetical protein
MLIEYNGKNYDIDIIRKNNKNIYIRVKNNKVIVTCNYFTTNKEIKRLIDNNYNSIINMIKKQESKMEKENKFYLFGKYYDVIYDSNIKIEIIDNTIYAKDEKFFNKWLSNYISSTFSTHLKYWYDRYEEDIPTPNLKIRKMKTRWGVCNIQNNNITLNSELYRYDIECLDYVIIHELSHFIEANHSRDFWIQVSKYCPNYKEIRKKLND